uniref:Uroplakin 3B n=1 Tax=Anser cygnoides TaxID=8845 RepID=A0A8B9EQ06_ANSCY
MAPGASVAVGQGQLCLGSPCHRQLLMAVPPALLPYVPRVPPGALLGKVTATTFALERPCCVFDRLANTSDAVWLVVAFANASATFRNPPSRADVPLYEGLPTAHAYMTLETAAAAYACSAPGPTVLRVGGDTACGGQHGQAACNGPLPSPGPYRVKFLVMDCHGPKAETRWSDPILLRRGTGGSGAGAASPSPCAGTMLPLLILLLAAAHGLRESAPCGGFTARPPPEMGCPGGGVDVPARGCPLCEDTGTQPRARVLREVQGTPRSG